MGTYRLPGPTCAGQQTLRLDDGTLPRQPGSRPGPTDGALPGHAADTDPRTLWRRAEAVREACAIALVHAPEAIVRATGLDDLPALLASLLDGVLGLLAVVAAGALLGGALGGAVGAVFGGVGAAPGAVLGAQLGTDAGVAVLGWLGLAFLVTALGRGLGEVSGRVTIAVGQAWDAEGRPQRQQKVEAAGQLLAEAVGRLVLLIVMAVVARLAAGQAATATVRAAGRGEEVDAALRASRLGARFADWVKANEARLLANPRLRMHNEVAGTGAKAAETVTPSQLRASGSGTVAGASTAIDGAGKKFGFPQSQLQHAFKHAKDFGVNGNANNKTLAAFRSALETHVEATGTRAIQGTYRGLPVTHHVDATTGLNVIQDPSGNFLSGWKLSPQQLKHVLTTGKLGGG